MLIAVPSYNRAGMVSTYKFLNGNCKIVIPNSQEKEYAEYYPQKALIAIPDEKDGNIAKKRNAVLDYTDDDEIVMMDDDLQHIVEIETGNLLNATALIHILENCFQMLRDCNKSLFGFNVSMDKMKYRPFQPFSLTKPFWGVVGIRKNGVRYDERLKRGEDVDFWLQNIKRDRFTIRFNSYHARFVEKKKSQSGGIAVKKETNEDLNVLLKKWGSRLLRIENGELKHVNSPISGV